MKHGKLAIGLGVLLTAILVLAACAGTPEPMVIVETVGVETVIVEVEKEAAPEPTVVVETTVEVEVEIEAAPEPWYDPYKEAEPELCPPSIECQDQVDFADPPVQELYEGKWVWAQHGLFKNAQSEVFGMSVTGATSKAVTDYTEGVKVCLDQVFTGEASAGKPSELDYDLLTDEFGANPEDLIIEIYLLEPVESQGGYVIDFVVDPTVTDGGTHYYQQKHATKAYANVSVAGSQGGGAVGAELFRNTKTVGETHVERGTALESDELSLTSGWMGAWWDLAVRGEDEGTYRVSGRYDYPASWDYEYRDVPPCESEDICLEMSPGQWATHTISHTTEESPIPNLDVLLLFDATGSMSGTIESVRESALEIMGTVSEKVPEAAFGVASFTDYPGYYECDGYADEYGYCDDSDSDGEPWNLDQPITTDTDAVQRSLDALQASGGGDYPECYTRALSETLHVSWRPGAKKVVVLFGDSVPHDTKFFEDKFGRNTGVDPGPDKEVGTEDDLDYAEAVGWLKEQEIEVIAINSAPEDPMAVASFEHVANETGGQAYPLARAADAPETVVSGLEAAMAEYNRLMVVPDNLTRGLWVTAKPWAYEGVGGGESHSFDVTVTVPVGAWPEVYEFDLTVLGDGLPLEAFHVMVYVK
jgi:hypothetical protein